LKSIPPHPEELIVYNGEWKNDQRIYGKAKFLNGGNYDTYEGPWKDDKPHTSKPEPDFID